MLDTFQTQESLGFFLPELFCVYQLFLSPDTLMSLFHWELVSVAKVNVVYLVNVAVTLLILNFIWA